MIRHRISKESADELKAAFKKHHWVEWGSSVDADFSLYTLNKINLCIDSMIEQSPKMTKTIKADLNKQTIIAVWDGTDTIHDSWGGDSTINVVILAETKEAYLVRRIGGSEEFGVCKDTVTNFREVIGGKPFPIDV